MTNLEEYATMAQMETSELDLYLMKKWFADKDSIEFWRDAAFTSGRNEQHDKTWETLLALGIKILSVKSSETS